MLRLRFFKIASLLQTNCNNITSTKKPLININPYLFVEMKKLLFLLFIAFGLNAQTVRRVSTGMNLQTEMDNSTAGDILMVEAGNYGAITFSKQLTLVGPGYANAQTATPGNAVLGAVKFNTGSAGSWLTGFQAGDINVSVSNVVVMRNYCGTIRVGINDAANSWQAVASNVVIKQNLATRLEIIANTSPGQVSNFSVKNNLFSWGFYLGGVIGGEIINNTFDYNLIGDESQSRQIYTSQVGFYNTNPFNCGKLNIAFKNNILTNISYSDASSCPIINYPTDVFRNNILHTHASVTSINIPNNTTITDLSTLYQGYPNNPSGLVFDARNQLTANSPAKGAGEDGTDCGAFGGEEPYVLSGVPFVPSIIDVKVPQTTSQNGILNIQIKAKTNN